MADTQAYGKNVPKKEIAAWAMFDVANSSYVTVVNTAIFNAYFVATVAAHHGTDNATLFLTSIIAVSNFLIVVTAPVIGALADFTARKKRMLAITSSILVIFTCLLSQVGPGDVALGLFVLGVANLMYGTGEDLIAAFLPEIAHQGNMGRVSALGWAVGYFGGIGTLAACLAYVSWAETQGMQAEQYTPVTMLIVAAVFATTSLPTFLFLKERARALQLPEDQTYWSIGFERLFHTLKRVGDFQDLFRFLGSLLAYTCGSTTVAVIAAIYAKEVMGFKTSESIMMILLVNVAGSIGAFIFGIIQDRLGSKKAVSLSLVVWIVAIITIILVENDTGFWIAALLMGAAMGGSQSAGRALVGQFAPPARSAEFFGLWGLAVKLASIIGPLSFGVLAKITGGNYRLSLVSTLMFFIIGLAVLHTVNEKRGKAVAASKQ